ncbi:MAG: ferritin-like domain-containing protein [Chitinophagales bacterium]|nr:ferritin-like domain-containing protein [Chitinophagales bacterium]
MLSGRSKGHADGFEELFYNELRDIYWAENALVRALENLADKAESEELVNALEDHIDVTEDQLDRLEEVFDIIGEPVSGKKCQAMAGLIKEGKELTEDLEEGPVRDAAIIAACQKVEHYEIATYGTLRTYASILGYEEAEDLLQETLDEEKEADELLSELSDEINIDVLVEDGEKEGEYEY